MLITQEPAQELDHSTFAPFPATKQLRYPCIPEAMAVANDDEWDDETYARQQVPVSSDLQVPS